MSNTVYHVGLGIFGIYAGTIRKPGEWKSKSDVTDEALDSVAGYLLLREKEVHFTYKEKKYILKVVEEQDETD
jgi:hypothetical protein